MQSTHTSSELATAQDGKINESDLIEGARVRLSCGSVFVVGPRESDNGQTFIRSKLDSKKYTSNFWTYRNELNDCVSFFNEEGGEVIK